MLVFQNRLDSHEKYDLSLPADPTNNDFVWKKYILMTAQTEPDFTPLQGTLILTSNTFWMLALRREVP